MMNWIFLYVQRAYNVYPLFIHTWRWLATDVPWSRPTELWLTCLWLLWPSPGHSYACQGINRSQCLFKPIPSSTVHTLINNIQNSYIFSFSTVNISFNNLIFQFFYLSIIIFWKKCFSWSLIINSLMSRHCSYWFSILLK